jgi:hypothetical protein
MSAVVVNLKRDRDEASRERDEALTELKDNAEEFNENTKSELEEELKHTKEHAFKLYQSATVAVRGYRIQSDTIFDAAGERGWSRGLQGASLGYNYASNGPDNVLLHYDPVAIQRHNEQLLRECGG